MAYGGYYFDADEPLGVEHPALLPLYLRHITTNRGVEAMLRGEMGRSVPFPGPKTGQIQ